MKKFLLILAVVAILLPSCKKIEESIDALENRIEALENETIPTIDEQIAAINLSLNALEKADEELGKYIQDLEAVAANLQEQIKATNTKIDEVKAALQGEISTAKAEVLAELEALETELKNELSQINATIETLKAKDAELDQKIADLKSYVDTELGKTTDWVNATFATLTQYNALVAEVTTIKAQIVAINESIADLETRLTTKINEDIANAVSTLNSTIQQKVSEITTAYTNAVKTAKDELTAAYTAAIATAISNLETSLKSWVGEQLENYYTIAEVNAKISALENAMTEGDEALQEELNALKSQLEAAKAELTEAYKKAIEEAINTYNGVINGKIAEEIATVNTRIDNEIATINAKISEIEARLDKVEAQVKDLLARIQSVSYIPEYADGKATVRYDDEISRVTLDFEVSPKDAVVELAKVWENAISLKAVYTQTRAVSFVDMPIVAFEADTANGIISVTASGENLSAEFFNGTQSASVRLSISDGNNSVTSDYIPMVTSKVTSMVLNIYTAEDLAKLDDAFVESATLMSTIDMSSVDWTPIENFSGVFDGNSSKGYEIKNLSTPLFDKITGEVTNLRITTNITTSQTYIGAIANSLSGAISDCEVYGEIELSDLPTSTLYIGGAVGRCLSGATMSNITNHSNISVSSTVNMETSVYLGGVVGSIPFNTNSMIDKCYNNGTIFFDAITASRVVRIGGVVGQCKSLSVNSMSNSGKIKYAGQCSRLAIGGVVGSTTGALSGDIRNVGDVVVENISSTKAEALVGGIVGKTTASIDGARCYCTVTAWHDPEAENNYHVGMITGTERVADKTVATNCHIGGKIDTGTEGRYQDPESGEIVEGWVSSNPDPISTSDYFKVIYGTEIEAATAKADNCGCISSIDAEPVFPIL